MYSVILTDVLCVCVCARMEAFTLESFNTTSCPPIFSVSISLLPVSLHIPSSLFFYPPILSPAVLVLLSPLLSQPFRVGALAWLLGAFDRTWHEGWGGWTGRAFHPKNSQLISYFIIVVLFISPLLFATWRKCPHISWGIARLPVFINLLCLFQEMLVFVFSLTQ